MNKRTIWNICNEEEILNMSDIGSNSGGRLPFFIFLLRNLARNLPLFNMFILIFILIEKGDITAIKL